MGGRARFGVSFAAAGILAVVSAGAQSGGFSPRGIGGGGALFSPSVSPHSPSVLYVACDMGETFRTTDGGASWRPVDFRHLGGTNYGCEVQFTSDPLVLYGIDAADDGRFPAKSTDGGATWQRLAADPTGGDAAFLEADPTSTSRLLLSSWGSLYYSSDGGASFSPRYTDATGNGCFVAGAFWDGSTIAVGTNAGLLVSANGGTSFALSSAALPAGEALVSFAGAHEGSRTRFYGVTLGSADVYPGVTGADHPSYLGVHVLDWDGTPVWERRTSGIAAGDHPFFVGCARAEADVAWLAGGNDEGVPIVYRTLDGGATWNLVFTTGSTQNVATGWCGYGGDRGWGYPEYAEGFAVSPSDPAMAVLSDMGFVHSTTDGGATWQALYVNPADRNAPGSPTPAGHAYRTSGLEDTSSWWLTWHSAQDLFASFTDIRGVRSVDGGTSWSYDYSGHSLNTMYQTVRRSDGTLYAATSSVHDLYESTYLTDSRIDGGSGLVLRSADGGSTWTTLHDFGHPVVWVALDPNNANRLYASVADSTQGGVFVSSDIQNGGASTWSLLAAPPRTAGHPYNVLVLNDGTLVCTYSGHRSSTGAFLDRSGVFLSTNGGASWVDRSAPGMHYWTKDLVLDPLDAAQNTWYACVFSGWGGAANDLGGLYRTTDRGLNWTRIFGETDHAEPNNVESCAFDPGVGGTLYLTTETQGLLVSTDIRAPQPTFGEVADFPFGHPLRVFWNPYSTGEMWVTTFGNGMYLRRSSCAEVSGTGAPQLLAARSGSLVDLSFEEVPGAAFNLYVSKTPQTHSFRVTAASEGKHDCALATQAGSGGTRTLSGYDLEAGLAGSSPAYYFLVSGDYGTGTEGPLGFDSGGQAATPDSSCAP